MQLVLLSNKINESKVNLKQQNIALIFTFILKYCVGLIFLEYLM